MKSTNKPQSEAPSVDELMYKFDKSLYDLFYKAFEAGEDVVLQHQFKNDIPAKHRYAERCIKEARNAIADILEQKQAKINRLIVEAQQELLRKLSNHRNFIYWGDGATSDLDNWIDKQKQELSNNLSKGEV